jgi:hypothetical protein
MRVSSWMQARMQEAVVLALQPCQSDAAGPSIPVCHPKWRLLLSADAAQHAAQLAACGCAFSKFLLPEGGAGALAAPCNVGMVAAG